MKSNRFLIVCLWLTGTITGYAQTKTKSFGLQECIEIAVKNNLQLKQSTYAIENAQNNILGTRGSMLPGVNASTNQGLTAGGRSINPFDNTVVQGETFLTNSMSLGGQVTLFNGFQIQNNLKQQKNELRAAQYDMEAQKNAISLNVANAFLNILVNKELLQASKFQVAGTQNEAERARKLFVAGSAPEANYLQLKAQLASEQANVVNNDNNLQLAKLNLQQLMQLPADEDFEIEIPSLPAVTIPLLESSSKEIYQYAQANMPEIKAADERIRGAENQIRAARAGYMPTLNLNGGFFTNYSSIAQKGIRTGTLPAGAFPVGYFDDALGNRTLVLRDFPEQPIVQRKDLSFSEQFTNNLRSSISLSLTVPIFSQLQNKVRTKTAAISRENARVQAQLQRNTLRQTIEQAYQQVKAAIQSYDAAKNAFDSQKESLRAIEARYQVGAGNIIDYTSAKNSLARAETDMVRAKYSYFFRLKVLDFYQGKSLSF